MRIRLNVNCTKNFIPLDKPKKKSGKQDVKTKKISCTPVDVEYFVKKNINGKRDMRAIKNAGDRLFFLKIIITHKYNIP